jgi:hypothetical protein
MTDVDRRPTYDLAELKQLVRSGPLGYRIEPPAVNGAGRLGFDETDIVCCILGLDARHRSVGGHFYKTMPSETRPGTFHDVYKTKHCGKPVYCKVQVMTTRSGSKAAVISFKEDESP